MHFFFIKVNNFLLPKKMKSLTKKIFITIITGIIIIVLGAWGMGDLFSSGNKNVIAEVGQKIYIKDYLNYARLYLRKKK